MKRLLLVIPLLFVTGLLTASAQTPREGIAKLQDLLRSVQRNEQGNVVQDSGQQPVTPSDTTNRSEVANSNRAERAQPGVLMQLSDQGSAFNSQSGPTAPSAAQPAERIAHSHGTTLPPGVTVPESKIPLPRSYHGRARQAPQNPTLDVAGKILGTSPGVSASRTTRLTRFHRRCDMTI